MSPSDEKPWPRGYVQVYTGKGKGKTTAALGLALRAAGAGLRVFFAQFIKGRVYSEIKALERFADLVTVRQFGRGRFVGGAPAPEDVETARRGLDEARAVLAAGEHCLVVLDEANVAADLGLFTVDELLAVVDAKPEGVELLLTGRNAPPELVARADLVTEMAEIKHYYSRGVKARTGIEM